MKILMTLESSFPPDKRVENEIDSLLAAGFEIHIICFGDKNSLKNDKYKSATVHRITPCLLIRKSSVATLKIPLYFIYWERKLRLLLKNHSFDVIHIHDLPLIKTVARLKKIYKFKIVLDLHENWPALLRISPHTQTIAGKMLCSIRQWEKYEKRYIRSADKVIVVVEEARERIVKLSVPEQKISIVSNTLNIKDLKTPIRRKKKGEGNKIFIYEGGISYHRGIQYVLEAFSRIESPGTGAALWIIGDGSYLNTLKVLCDKMNLNHIVKFFGWQPQDKVFELINQADIALIPHMKSAHTDTTIPHKLFHYMYAGLPILASNCNPLERIINETSAGYIYKYDDISELASIIKNIISDETSLKVKNGEKWIARKYNWSREHEKLIAMYSNLLEVT